MENFTGYLHLDSNTIDARNTEVNTASTFVNYLTSTYNYTDDNYECALTEILFPRSWYNVPKDQFVGVFDDNDKCYAVRYIPEGWYAKIEDLLKVINDTFVEFFPQANRGTDVKRNAFYVNQKNQIWCKDVPALVPFHIKFTMRLSQLLGYFGSFFVMSSKKPTQAEKLTLQEEVLLQNPMMEMENEGHINVTNKFESDTKASSESWIMSFTQKDSSRITRPTAPYDITGGMDHIFVYTDVIKGHSFGNSWESILEVIPITRSENITFGEIIHKSFNTPKYYPLQNQSFNSIKIFLRDREGSAIDFVVGSVILSLHIRKKKWNSI